MPEFTAVVGLLEEAIAAHGFPAAAIEVGGAGGMPRERALVEDADRGDARADRGRGETRPDDLDLGQFRHGR